MRRSNGNHRGKTILLLAGLFLLVFRGLLASVPVDDAAASILSKAESFRLAGEYGKALDALNDPALRAATGGDPSLASRYASELILDFWNSGRVKDSEAAARNALSIRGLGAEDRGRFEDILRIHRLYAEAKEQRLNADIESSIKSFEEAVSISKKLAVPDFELKCLRQMSLCFWDRNDFDDFNSLNQAAFVIAARIHSVKDKSICLNNIGLYYWKTSNYAKALESYEKALELAESSRNDLAKSECMNNLGIIYQELGDFNRALSYFTASLDIDKEISEKAIIAIDLNNIGNVYRKKGLQSGERSDFLTALQYYENCLSLTEKTNDFKNVLNVHNNIGTIHSDLEEYSDSIIQYKKALEIAQRIDDKEGASTILNNLGTVYFNLGDFEESTKYCQMSIDLAQQINSGAVLWEAFLDIGNAYKKQSKFEEARKSYRQSIDVVENIRSTIEIEELKASYFGSNKRLDSYYNLIDLLARAYASGRDRQAGSEAFELLEKAKARAFLDSLEVAQVNISQGVDIRLINREKQIDRDLTTLYKQMLIQDLPEERKGAIREQIRTSEDELERLKREIRSTSPAYADLKYPQIISLDQARKNLLDAKTAVVAYSVGKDSAYGMALTRKGLTIFPISTRKRLQQRVAEHLKSISDKDRRDHPLAADLYSELIGPAVGPGIERLTIVPDDALHYLPFETLRNTADSRWLVEDYAVSYAPSLSSLWEIVKHGNNRKEKRTKDLLAFGDPDYGRDDAAGRSVSTPGGPFSAAALGRLKYSGMEVQQISSALGSSAKDIRLLDRASEHELKSLPLQSYKIIHLAAHAVIDDQKPARSAIVLSINGDDKEDGLVQMREIYNLRLNADLVSLSACQTGRGQYIQGEGIESLNRAFFYAGASAVLTSLWSINDQASAQLMARFYTHLKSGMSLMDALRAAKIEMIRSGVVSHPYFWGGFILTGDASRKPFPKTRLPFSILVLAVSLVMGFAVARKVGSREKAKPAPKK